MSKNQKYAKLILYRGLANGYGPRPDLESPEGGRSIFQFICRQLRVPDNLSMDGYAMVPSEEEAARIISHTQGRFPTEIFPTIKVLGLEGGKIHFQRQLSFIGWDESRRTELVDLLTESGAKFSLEPQGDIMPLTFHSDAS
ncbi:hypothetical protein HN499_01970 [archaeon]|nr:hypothetical protein [archaeon]